MTLWVGAAPLVLASQSRSRQALLAAAGVPFKAIPADIDERGFQAASGLKDPAAIAALLVATVAMLFVVHAALALRKFPANYRQYRTYRDHLKQMRHEDTTLWYWQVVTGFALFFLASVHLYIMMTRPDTIGP